MKKKTLISLFCVLAMIAFTLFTGCGSDGEGEEAAAPTETIEATCNNGVMVGAVENGIASYKGIPYAQQPVDDLRWKAPLPAEDSDETIECFEFGHTACQYEWPTEPASYNPKGEDCLSLNIWTSTEETDKPKAVMFWVHGGSNAWGGTSDPIYDGQQLIEAHPDIVFVSANYRLGMYSWPDFSDVPGGEEYTDINLGLRDQICALEWVQKNIEQFGGDPENVTIFGESAGGGNVTALMVSPMAEGLFQKVIAESGVAGPSDRQEAKDFAQVIMDYGKCKTMDDVLAKSAEEWMKIDTETWISDESCGYVSDGVVVPTEDQWDAALQNAADRGIKLMSGSNAQEWNYFMVDSEGETDEEKFDSWYEGVCYGWDEVYKASDENAALMDEFYEIKGEEVAEEYAKDEKVKDALIKSDFRTASWRQSHINLSEKYSDCGGDTWLYYWDVPSTKEDYFKSACHAVELAYVLANPQDDIYSGEVDKATAKAAQEAWTNFAKTGDPSTSDVEWSQFNSTDRNTMVVSLDGWKVESDPLKRIREIMVELDTEFE